MSPNPGPTFEIAEAADEIHVKKSSPLNDNRSAEEAKVKIYKKKKLITDSYVDSGILLLLK